MTLPVDLTIGGIALIPVIVALVELAKMLGLPVDFAPWLTGALAVVGYVLVILVTAHPEFLQAVTVGLTAVIIFLSATGLYKTAQRTAAAFSKK